MDVLLVLTLAVTGFVGCGEFASVALVHPVIRTLPEDSQLLMEQGLLRTFGRVTPVGMTAAPVLAGLSAAQTQNPWYVAAAVVLTVALVVTIVGNVPINLRTGQIRATRAPEGFIAMRRRWDLFQLVRGSLQLLGFLLVAVAVVAGAA